MKKKLSVAILWHMHQPIYQDTDDGMFYMPWVRMHAVKDYLDMLLIMNKFPNLKLNFNLSPTILDAFQKYEKGYNDIHSLISVKPVEELTKEDKLFILNYFFDANYTGMITKYKGYLNLYKKRNSVSEVNVDDFTDQEYSDIIFWFNVAWIDPVWFEEYPKLKSLVKKQKGYTIKDRKYVIDVHLDIIKKIIPSYKKFQNEERIEISTNPMFHPILPLLINKDVANNSTMNYPLPECEMQMREDAKTQVIKAISVYEELFDKKPKGMWPSELSVSDETLDLFSECGIEWTVTDEGLLAETLGKEFLRDNRGNLEDPYDVSTVYTYENNDSQMGVFFRNTVIPKLIGFEYPRYDSVQAANDLYERLKHIQDKLQTSPDKNHIALIAMDGENSWENYVEDGNIFLEKLYSLITSDETLETVTLSDYYLKNKNNNKIINNIVPGSLINKNFELWIAEPTKNKAWEYIAAVRDDLINYQKNIDDENLKAQLWSELYVAEGSDWFWWFGEPNDSGQDNLFDYLFRKHLQNIYTMTDNQIPDFLTKPLTMVLNSPSRYQKSKISPEINGRGDSEEWQNAGCIEIPSGPLSDNNQILTKICYGTDIDKLYLKIDLNHYTYDKLLRMGLFYQIYIYIKNKSLSKSAEGKIRLVMRPEALTPILKESFSHEIKLTFSNDKNFPVQVAYSNKDGIWLSTLNNKVKCMAENVIEIEIPFSDIDLKESESADFIVIDGAMGRGIGSYPRDMFITIQKEAAPVLSK